MEEVDTDIYFLEEKPAELRQRSDTLKISTPRPTTSRNSGVDILRIISDTSQKKEELSLRTNYTTALHLEDATAMKWGPIPNFALTREQKRTRTTTTSYLILMSSTKIQRERLKETSAI